VTTALRDLAGANPAEIQRAIDGLTESQAEALLCAWREWARPEQVEPDGQWWSIWLAMAGRGWGKTRVGAEWIRERVDAGARRVALVAPTAADARDTMVEGESGLLSIYPQRERPHYEPSKRRVVWPNGASATLFSADEPDRLRGPQHAFAWCDELAVWRHAQDAWDNLMFGLRLGRARALVTTTPKPIKLIRDLVAREGKDVVLTRGRTADNLDNLSSTFRREIMSRYEGTRVGRQELDAELLEDVEGALWSRAQIEAARITDLPDLRRIVVGVDPAGSSSETADHTGIVVCGVDTSDNGVVLADYSMRGTPAQWARAVHRAFDDWEADRVIAEKNQGGEMVSHTLRSEAKDLPIRMVHASRGKIARAEPVSALSEQGRVHHYGSHPELEDELCTYDGSGDSPDRLDAFVWAMTDLMVQQKQRWRPL